MGFRKMHKRYESLDIACQVQVVSPSSSLSLGSPDRWLIRMLTLSIVLGLSPEEEPPLVRSGALRRLVSASVE